MNAQEKLEEIKKILTDNKIPAWPANWKDRRIYLNLEAARTSYRGDKTHDLYYDLIRDCLVSESGKGVESSKFIEEYRKVEALFGE